MESIQQTIKSYLLDEMLYDAPDNLNESTSLIKSRLLDSLGLMRIVAFLEKKFGVQVKPYELVPQNFETIQAIAGLVQRLTATTQPEEISTS